MKMMSIEPSCTKFYTSFFPVPDYPCFDCISPDTCVEDRCLQSENKCPGLKEAFKCVENVCKSNPCKNNGTCTPIPANVKKYRCTCSDGFTGKSCTLKICDDDKCKNGGRCRSKTDSACECPPDVWGNMCEIRNGEKHFKRCKTRASLSNTRTSIR